MNATEIREMSDQELLSEYDDTKQELFNLRFQLATGQLDNHARIRQVRRDVARLRTVIREREIAAAEAIAAGTDQEDG